MKLFLLSCFAFMFLVGCKKSESTQHFQSYFRMTIDGTRTVTADQEITASNPRTPLLVLYGRWSTGELRIELNSYDNSLGEKIIVANPGGITTPRFSLFDPGSEGYYAGDDGISQTVTGSGKINILEISNEYIKGTFQFISGPRYNVIRTVTNGEFHIKRAP